MKYPLKLSAAIAILFFFTLDASAQKKFDCKKLLKQDVTQGDPKESVNNITQHADCFGLDSVDLRIYGQPEILDVMLVKIAKNKSKVTYADLLADINAAKKDTGYAPIRNLITAQMTLEKRRFTPDNWQSSIPYLKTIGMPDSEMEAFHNYLVEKQEHHWTYRQLVTGYQMRKESTAPVKQN